MPACEIEGCTNHTPYYAKGMCRSHYDRQHRSGSPHPVPRPPRARCSVSGCPFVSNARGWCSTHYYQWRDRGYVDAVRQEYRIGYFVAHSRIRRALGSATAHSCVECHRPAQQWAYQHGAPDERSDEKTGLIYSEDPSFYAAMCLSCHKRYDNRVAGRGV